jgi:hypothetical protein
MDTAQFLKTAEVEHNELYSTYTQGPQLCQGRDGANGRSTGAWALPYDVRYVEPLLSPTLNFYA